MATSIHVRCMDCTGDDGFPVRYDPDAKLYWSDELWQLVDQMPALYDTLHKLWSDTVGVLIQIVPEFPAQNKYGLTEFIGVHGKHHLEVYDENGQPVERPKVARP